MFDGFCNSWDGWRLAILNSGIEEVVTHPKEKEMNKSKTLLNLDNVTLTFGKVVSLSDISFDVYDNEILSIIGPNGAGKTSVINCISGFYKPSRGSVLFEGKDITRGRPDKIARLGIGRTFQNIQLYTGLTTLDNIMAGRHLKMKCGFASNAVFFGRTLREEKRERRIVEEIIDVLNLQEFRDQVVGTLAYGTRKVIELGRALALEPKMLILDEPMAGMNVEEKEDMARYVIDIYEGQKRGYDSQILKNGVKSIIFIEHNMDVVMDIADRIIVMDFGIKIADGIPEEIRADAKVIKAYLGE